VSDYETGQRRRNVIVGIFVVAALAALGIMIAKFGELPMAVSQIGAYHVKVQFPTAKGVQKDTPVQFCGYQIGRVTDVKPPKIMKDLLSGKFYHQTLVVLAIDDKYNDIPEDIDVKLMTRGLGSSFIELKQLTFDVNEPTGPFLEDNTLLQGSTGMTSEFFPEESQQKLQELVDGLRTLTDNFNDIIGDADNKQNFKQMLANFVEASGEATETLRQARQTLDKASSTMEEYHKLAATGTATLRETDVKIGRFVTAFVDTSEQLSKATVQLRTILEKINSGKGTTARFLNDGRFYEKMLENTDQIELLLRELKAFTIQAREKGLPIKLK